MKEYRNQTLYHGEYGIPLHLEGYRKKEQLSDPRTSRICLGHIIEAMILCDHLDPWDLVFKDGEFIEFCGMDQKRAEMWLSFDGECHTWDKLMKQAGYVSGFGHDIIDGIVKANKDTIWQFIQREKSRA